MAKSKTAPIVILACAMPPPIYGQSVVNAAIRDAALAQSRHVLVADISADALIKTSSYHLTRLWRVMKAFGAVLKYSNRNHRQIYMVTQVGYGIFYNHAILGLARLLKYRIILHHHDSAHTKFYRRSVAFLIWLIGPAAIHVALGPAMADDLKRYKQVQRVIVCQNARIIPDAEFVRPPRAANTPLRIGHMSNLSRLKGLNLAIDSILVARSRGIDVRLVLAGPFDGAEAEATVREAQKKLGDALDYRGPVGGDTKDQFFKDIDVFLFPTIYKYEAQPLVILEAMSYSAALIVAERGYTAELVDQSGDVYAGDADFPAKTADRLAQLVANADDLYAAQTRARARYLMLRKIATEQFDQLIDILVS